MSDPQEAGRRLGPAELGGAVATGVLVVFSFPLFGASVGLEGTIWVAFVPLILAAFGAGPRRGFVLGATAGTVIEGAGFVWILVAIRNFTAVPAIVASLGFFLWVAYSTVPWAIFGAALGAARRPGALLWVVAFWVGLEHHYPRVFPWHVGGALYSRPWLVQTADVWGASGLTGLVLLANASAALVALRCARRARIPWLAVGGTAALIAASLAYGAVRLREVERLEAEAPRLRVAIVQAALDPRERKARAFDVYREATRELLSRSPADLAVWPEGAAAGEGVFPFDLAPEANRPVRERWRDPDAGSLLQALAEELRTPIAAGGTGLDASRRPPWSNVLAYARPGEPLIVYEKNWRLPLGEVVPFLDLVPEGLRERLGLVFVGTIAAGRTNPLAPCGPHRFRSLICYEATLPGYVARSAAGADFLVNITEDAWYGRTAHIPQHVSVLQLRVVENRIPLVRAANMGPSGVFGITGRLEHPTRIFREDRAVAELKVLSLPTAYRSWGRHLPLAALLASIAAAARFGIARRFSRGRPWG